MTLISVANFQALTDRYADAFRRLVQAAGISTGNPVAGTVRNSLNNALTTVAGLNDYFQELDLAGSNQVNLALTKAPGDKLASFMQQCLNDLTNHMSARGSGVSNTIQDVPSFLAYYNGGSGGNKFSSMVTVDFGRLWKAVQGAALGYPYVEYEPVSSIWGANSPYAIQTYPNGFASKVVGGAFTAGFTIDNTTYAEQNLIAVVTTNITGGSGSISVTVTGVDDAGTTGVTWGPVVLTGGNNPTAAISQQTISSGALNAQARQTVTVGSTTGIVPGSVVTINKGLPDQEFVLVEAVVGATFTAVFSKAHNASATVDGNTSTAMGAASSGAGRRCRQVTAITYTLNGQSAGVVEIDGYPGRVSV